MSRTEIAAPLAVERPELRNITDLLAARVAEAPDHVAFGRRVGSTLADVSTADFERACRGLAKGLIAQGVTPGDRVLVMAPTRYEWALADFAVLLAGGVVVPVYESSSTKQVGEIVAATTPRLSLVSGLDHVTRLAQVPAAPPAWTMDPSDRDLAALAASGDAVGDDEVERRRTLAGPDDLATIVFTSGTTGRQKGVRLTHGKVVGLVLQVAHDYAELIHDQAVTVVALPLAHILARALQLCAVGVGMKVVHEGDPTRVVATIAEVRPTFMVVVPRVLEKIRAAARNKATDTRLGRVFAAAEATAVEWARFLEARQDDPDLRPSVALRLRHALFDRLFYRRLRSLLGGRLDWLLAGAAPLDPTLARFFWGLGIPVIEGYGLTETTAPATGTRPGDLRPGSVGTPLPGTQVRIADDGEVLLRGVGVFEGYLDPADDDGALVEGWFKTGDFGSLDDAGRLRLHGRKKNLIVTASGKNVAPEPWEEAVARSPLVAQAVVVGEGRPYLTALVLLDREAAVRWAHRAGRDALAVHLQGLPASAGGIVVDDPGLHSRVQRSVDRANAAVSKAEQVKRFAVLVADLTDASGTFTPTLKLRRDAFLRAAAPHLDALYSPGVTS